MYRYQYVLQGGGRQDAPLKKRGGRTKEGVCMPGLAGPQGHEPAENGSRERGENVVSYVYLQNEGYARGGERD